MTGPHPTTIRPFIALRRAAAAGFFGFFTIVAVATLLQPASYRTSRDFVSGLAATDASYAWVMMTGFQVGAVGLVATALLLFQRLPSVTGRVAAALVLTSGVALGVAGFARFDCGRNDSQCLAQLEAGMSFHSHLHGLAALLVFLPLIVASFWLAAAVWRSASPHRSRLGLLVLTFGVIELALTVMVEEHLTASPGLVQRIDLLVMFGVPLAVALGRWGFAPDRLPAEARERRDLLRSTT